MHRLLRRQLIRHFGSLDAVPTTLAGLILSVDQAYQQADDDRELVERSLDLTSQELLKRNAELREDIVRREAAEAALRASEAQTKSILHGLPDMVFLLSREGRFLDCHAPSNDVLVLNELEVIGLELGDVMPTPFCDALLPRLQHTLDTGELQQWDLTLRGETGTQHLEVRLGGCAGESLLVVVRDVTEKQKMHDRLSVADRLASVGGLAAGVAHEINNPLTYVIANVEIVLETLRKLDPLTLQGSGFDVLQALEEAMVGAQRVKEIVHDLRSFSRTQSQAMSAVDIGEAMRSAINMANNEIRHRASLVVELGESCRAHVNEARIRQVFLNLLVNAAQALPVGEARHNEIRVRSFDDGDYITVEVKDTGPGIPPESLPRIFDPFFTTKPIGEGTGLGLSICHNLVTTMGGEILVDSSERGTTFSVRLLRATEEPIAAPSTAPIVSSPGARVLVVDDDVHVASSLARMLDTCDVSVATSGRDALLYLAGDADFDIVLCDLMMPDMSGMELYERLQEINPDVLTRVVFMTGGTFTERASEFIRDTTNDVLEKPFDSSALKSVVEDYYRRRRNLAAAAIAD